MTAMTARSRSAYFQALGIDVWVRRGTRSRVTQAVATPDDARALASPTRPTQSLAQRPRRSPSRNPALRSPAPVPDRPAAEEAFRVRCFHYGRVFAALGKDAWPMRRFLFDVAWALNGFERAERRNLVFDWPQPGAVADGGAEAFGTFVRHQTRTQAGTSMFISGAQVASLLGQSAPNESCILDGRLYVRPDALDTAGKRTLWRLIQEMGESA